MSNFRLRFVRRTAFALVAGAVFSSSGGSLSEFAAERVFPADWDGLPASTTVAVMRDIYRADVACDMAWTSLKSKAEYDRHRLELRRRMLSAIGEMPMRTPLNAKVVGVVRNEGYRVEKVIFESMPGNFVTANLFVPDNAMGRPAVVMSCGHSAQGKDASVYLRACVLAVRRGFVALMFDPYYQGERSIRGKVNMCQQHNQLGLLASLIDWSMPMLRIWDGMRAIDYVQSRPEVDPDRIGYMGQSGGGTMTALMAAADSRIKAACPSCYLTSFRDLCVKMGPQDAEQNIYGQLAFGLNHTGYVLIPDVPIALTAKFGDMFPYWGVQSLMDVVRKTEQNVGIGERTFLNDAQGPHGWTEATEQTSVDFLAKNLLSEYRDMKLDLYGNRLLDIGFDIDLAELGLTEEQRGCTPDRSVFSLPGAKDPLDIVAERAAGKRGMRKLLTREELGEAARRLARIARPNRDSVMVKTFVGGDGVIDGSSVFKVALLRKSSGESLPAVFVAPKSVSGLPPVLVASFKGRADGAVLAKSYLAEGRTVLIADVSGVGEVGMRMYTFYEAKDRADEGLGAMCYLLGKPLVGKRAEDLLAFSDFLAERCGARPLLVAEGPLSIPAAHAFAAETDAWSGIRLVDRPDSWRDSLEGVAGRERLVYYADIVPRAYLEYDWTDLLPETK